MATSEPLWRILPLDDLLRLCSTSKAIAKVCQSNYTWQYLLQRDFNINYFGPNAKDKYLSEYYKDKCLNQHFYALYDEDNDRVIEIYRTNDINKIYQYYLDEFPKGDNANIPSIIYNSIERCIVDEGYKLSIDLISNILEYLAYTILPYNIKTL